MLKYQQNISLTKMGRSRWMTLKRILNSHIGFYITKRKHSNIEDISTFFDVIVKLMQINLNGNQFKNVSSLVFKGDNSCLTNRVISHYYPPHNHANFISHSDFSVYIYVVYFCAIRNCVDSEYKWEKKLIRVNHLELLSRYFEQKYRKMTIHLPKSFR